MCSKTCGGNFCSLSDDGMASAINLAFFLESVNYEIETLKIVSETLTESQKLSLYYFWKNLSPTTMRAWLCMAEFEERI